MNKENKYSNLASWCEKYHKESGLKVHPSSVPVDLVLEDILGYVSHLRSNVLRLINVSDALQKKFDQIEEKLEMVTNSIEQLKSTSTKKVK